MKKIGKFLLFLFVWFFYVAIAAGVFGVKGTFVYLIIFGLTGATVRGLMSAFGFVNKSAKPRKHESDNARNTATLSPPQQKAENVYSLGTRGSRPIEPKSVSKVAPPKPVENKWKVRAIIVAVFAFPIVLCLIMMFRAQSDRLYDLPTRGKAESYEPNQSAADKSVETVAEAAAEYKSPEEIMVEAEAAAARHRDSLYRDSIYRQQQLERERYKHNRLENGAKPYRAYYGKDRTGYNYMDFKTEKGYDYVVIVKRSSDMRVMNHVYIRGGRMCRLYLPDGEFNVYFYSGTGWNPNIKIKGVKGGFMESACNQKDEGIRLYDSYVTYTLYRVPNGNLHLQQSSVDETF